MQKRNYLALFIVAISCCASISFIESRAANVAKSTDIGATLSQLENRFFEHEYDSDVTSDRLDRLEEFIFGKPEIGSTNDRLTHILSTIPKEEENQDVALPIAHTSKNSASQDEKPKQTVSSPQNQTFDYGSYPRVSNLEQELLGCTYKQDILSDRINRLETKAYGAPTKIADLGQRVDLLDDYAERHDLYGEHKPLPPVNTMAFNPTIPIRSKTSDQSPWMNIPPSNSPQEYTSSDGSFIGSAEERVSMMEAQVFKHTYPDKPIDERLRKLEKKILPNRNIATLSSRAQTVRLWNTLHPNEKKQVELLADNDTGQSSVSSDDNSTSTTTSSTKKQSWLHKLAAASGTLAGTSMGPSTSMPTTYGTNAPYYPSGMGGRFVGASVGPGAGPAGLPIGFW